MDIPLPSYDTAKRTISSRSPPPDVHPVQALSLSPEETDGHPPSGLDLPEVEEGRPPLGRVLLISGRHLSETPPPVLLLRKVIPRRKKKLLEVKYPAPGGV